MSDEEKHLFICLLARSMAEFPLWAQRKREADSRDTQDRYSGNGGCESGD